MTNLSATLIGTLIGATLTGSVAFLLAHYNNRKIVQRNLKDQLDNILKLGVQYPYLEYEEFANSWDKEKLRSINEKEAEKYQRYDIYMNLVFNYLERLCEYHNYSSDSILNDVNIKPWVRTHRKIWENPTVESENHDGYSNKFKTLVTNYLR